MKTKISPCLWFDTEGEEAARYYTGIFKDSKIIAISRYPDAGKEIQDIHGRAPGSVMTVVFELNGLRFTALNGGPIFKFSEAISLQVDCETQEEIDYYWDKLKEGGPVEAQQCGWVKDKFGLSWQIVPKAMEKLMDDPDKEKVARVFKAMMGMKKLDIAALEAAGAGIGS